MTKFKGLSIKESPEESYQNENLSILQLETVSFEIMILENNLLLALGMGNIVSNYENMDLLTPNILNTKPISPMLVAVNLSDIMTLNEKIFNTSFEMWFMSHVPKLMHQPFRLWHKVPDIALFIRHDSTIASKHNSHNYQYGMVNKILPNQNGIIWKVFVSNQALI